MKIQPLGDRVLVEPLSREETEGRAKFGLVIPDTAEKERPEQGKVVAVGKGRHTEEGKIISLTVKKGDRVLFSKYGPAEIKVDGKNYLIVKEEDILAVIE